MNLDLLPVRNGGAAENMAADFLLLQRYPDQSRARFRHYGWREPAFTFGYSQKIETVRATLADPEAFDLCRRPTGGAIVDHRDDWTYALVAPRGSSLEEMRAVQSYRAVHEALAAALHAQGIPGELNQTPASNSERSLCFAKAELYDIIHAGTGEKIAGAAQKRNKRGLLCQGSLWRPAIGGAVIDWDELLEDFATRLAAALGGAVQPVPWPEWEEEEVSGLTERYASPEWVEMR
jgi:lipoate-protein ligase A